MNSISPPVDLIKKSLAVFFKKENLSFFVIIYIPLAALSLISVVQNNVPVLSKYSALPWFTSVSALFAVIYFLVSIWIGISGIGAVRRVVNSEELSTQSTFRDGWKKFWGFLLLSILLGLIIFGGVILLIVPAVIFSVWFSLSKFVFVEEGLGIKASLSRSKELVKGRFWPILGRLFVFGLFGLLVQILFGIMPFGIGSVFAALFGALFILPPYFLYLELKGM